MRTRPVLAVSTALVLLGGGVTGAALAVDPVDAAPAAGSATTSLTLLDVALGGKTLSVLELALRSDTLTGTPTTSFVVTPLTADGTAYGRQSLRDRSAVLPAVDSTTLAPAALSAVAAARSPQIAVRSDGSDSRATATSLGALSLLGLPLAVDGSLSIGSAVDGVVAEGGKTLTITDLALPSVADLIAALGLDLTALPADSLTDLLDGLDLDSTLTDQARAALEQALAPVQPQVDAAEGLVASTGDAVAAATEDLAAAEAALAPATKALNDATRALTGTTAGLRMGRLIGGLPDPVTTITDPVTTITDPVTTITDPITGVTDPITSPVTDPLPGLIDDGVQVVEDTVDPVLETVVDPVVDTVVPPVTAVLEPVLTAPVLTDLPPALQPLVGVYDAAKKAYDTALADVTDAQALLAAATQLLADAQAALDALLAPYQQQVDALVDAVLGLLDGTPLVSLDRLEVTTRSTVTSAEAGGQTAEVVGGEVEGLRVLGTDVLQQAVGSSQVDLLDLTAPVTRTVDSAVSGLTGTLSTVLSQVPGLPGLEVPAPKVQLLSRATSTDVVDGFGVAGSALRALTVTWPGLTIPAAAALPGAATLPSVTGLLPGALGVAAVGDVLTQPLTLSVATLQDSARFRPAALAAAAPGTAAPGTGTPGTATPGTATPGTGTPGTGTPSTGTPGTGTPGTGTPGGPTTTPVGLTQLPRTGLGSEPSVVALLLVAAALGLHRRYRAV